MKEIKKSNKEAWKKNPRSDSITNEVKYCCGEQMLVKLENNSAKTIKQVKGLFFFFLMQKIGEKGNPSNFPSNSVQ